MLKSIIVAGLVLAMAGCASKATTKLIDKTHKFESHREPVCLMRSPMPSEIKFTIIGELNGSKKTYGSVSEIIPAMADEARKVGADAIINLQTGQKWGLLAFARPVGSGTAIRLEDRKGFDCVSRGGEWR